MSKPFLKPAACFALAWSLMASGCQQPAEPHAVQEQMQHQQAQHEALDLSQMCQQIKPNMAEINDQRTAFALEQINQDLKVCLPLLSLEQQKELLALSTQMYKKFLHVERTPAQQIAFEKYAFDMAQHPTIHQSHFEQLALRDQYLLKHQGQAYIELADTGSAPLHYRRSPEYLSRIFAPYMPEAEAAFIENLSKQNLEQALQNGTLMIEPFEVARRALFWEDYLQRYPNSSYRQDAEYLYARYQQLLFLGTKASPVSEGFSDRYAVQASSWEEIEKLAALENSALKQRAQKFLALYQMTAEQRDKALSGSAALAPERQLARYLNLPKAGGDKSCLLDGVCV